MVLIFAGALILFLGGAVLVIIGRHIPAVAMLGEEEIARVQGEEPLYRKLLRFVSAKQRTLVIKALLKFVHRLRIISLRADSASSRLIDRLRSEHRSYEEEERTLAEQASQEAFVNKLLEHNIDNDAYRAITDFYLKKEGVPSRIIKKRILPRTPSPRATLADVKPRRKRTVVK